MPANRIRFEFKFLYELKQLPMSFIMEKPPHLVLDFVNSSNQLARALNASKDKIGSMLQYQIVTVGDRIRAIFDFTSGVSYRGEISGSIYTLMISSKDEALISPKGSMYVTNRKVHAHYSINNISFRGTEKQGGRLILDMSDTGVAVDTRQNGRELLVSFMSTKIPQHLMKRYDVADFHSPVKMIRAEQDGKTTKISLVNAGNYGHFAYELNKQFIIDVFPLTADEIQQAKLQKKVFIGKPISLNFQSIEVRAVLQLLADFTGINIVASDAVKGSITLRLNNVPWDQALDVILSTQGLDKRQFGDVILIDKATAFIARETDALKGEIASKKLAALRSELLQINYAKAADIATMLKDKNNSLLSERGALSVDVRTNTIWLQDTPSKIEEIRDLVKQLDIPVKQVVIEARIVEMSKQCEEDLGVAWGVSKATHLSGTLAGANQLAQGIPPPSVNISNPPDPLRPFAERLNVDLVAAPKIGTAVSVGLALAKLGSGILLDLELSALESVGNAEIIASPRLMTTDRKSAEISSGEDIPYQQSTSSGATAVSFKQAVLSLKVTPQITPDGKLLMDLFITQNANSGENVQGVPIITTKSIQTNVLVNNGQTIVLGGIYTQNKNNSIVRVPFLGTLPIFGHLFSKSQTTSNNDELLIFITPRIISNNLSITTIDGTARSDAMVSYDK